MARKGGRKGKPWRASWLDAGGTRHAKVFRYKADPKRYGRDMRKAQQRAICTLDDWLAGGGEDRVMSGLAPSTKRTYRGHLHLRFIPDIGGVQVHKITPDDIERARDKWLEEGLGPSAVTGTINALARVFRTMRKARLIPDSPIGEVDRPPFRCRRRHLPSRRLKSNGSPKP